MFFGVSVSFRILYSFGVYLYLNGSGSITSVGEERANLSAAVYLLFCGFCLGGFLFLWVLEVGYVILMWQSLSLPYNYSIFYALIVHHSRQGPL